MMEVDVLLKELRFKAIRSSGPGGQHVNKTATKIEVAFNVYASEALSDSEKELLTRRLSSKITSTGTLLLQCGETRSQLRNKNIVTERLLELLSQNLIVPKVRKKRRPSKNSKEKRLKLKRDQSQKKANRKPPPVD